MEIVCYNIVSCKTQQKKGDKYMFNKLKLDALIAEKGLTKIKLAELLKISPVTLHRKIDRSGNFSKEEIVKLIEIFGKEQVLALFFN